MADKPRLELIGFIGPVNGLYERKAEGSYLNLVIVEDHGAGPRREYLVSRGAAENLIADAQGVMRLMDEAKSVSIPHEGRTDP